MKFVIENFVYKSMRSLNVHQFPETDVVYEADESGQVKDMLATVKFDGEEWLWIPTETATGSYYFNVPPIVIYISIIE